MSDLFLSVNAIEEELSERHIETIEYLTVSSGVAEYSGCNDPSRVKVEGNGNFKVESSTIRGNFHGELGPYQLKVVLGSYVKPANGLSVRIKLDGWDSIRYLAVGHTDQDSNKFQHIKINNPKQGGWVDFSIGLNDLANLIQNGWEACRDAPVGDLRLYVSGSPSAAGAQLELSWGAVWKEKIRDESTELPSKEKCDLYAHLLKYFHQCNPLAVEQVQHFMASGECPMSGKVALPWKLGEEVPGGMAAAGTYRYLWHSLQPAILMLIYAEQENDDSAIYSARDIVAHWLTHSFFSEDPDKKYTWYDHGTAERLMALLMIQQVGIKKTFDYRFMARLQIAIKKHGQLLESEAFYAYCQPTRYHNHAWFQDMALIAAGVALPELHCSDRWIKRGIKRLEDQLSNLIVKDQDFSIFNENSIGYHQGVQRLIHFASELVKMTGRDSRVLAVPEQLELWSNYFKYPNGYPPAQGDTFKAHVGLEGCNASFVTGVRILKRAGYAIAKGESGGTPFMLCMLATSLNVTHKHQDNLAISLFYDDVEWLVDPSFYSHNYDERIPAYLRSAEAHNCIWVPNVAYSIEPGTSHIDGLVEGNHFSFEGTHTSYADFLVRRKVKGVINGFRIEVSDSIFPSSFSLKRKKVSPRIVLHFGVGVQVKKVSDGLELSHVNSNRRVLLALPVLDCDLVYGASGDRISVIGLGFMEYVESWSALINIPLKKEINWSILLK